MPRKIKLPKEILSKKQVDADGELLTRLKNTTPDQAAQWVQNNVNSLAEAKSLLKILTKAVVYLLHQTKE